MSLTCSMIKNVNNRRKKTFLLLIHINSLLEVFITFFILLSLLLVVVQLRHHECWNTGLLYFNCKQTNKKSWIATFLFIIYIPSILQKVEIPVLICKYKHLIKNQEKTGSHRRLSDTHDDHCCYLWWDQQFFFLHTTWPFVADSACTWPEPTVESLKTCLPVVPDCETAPDPVCLLVWS